MDDNFFYAISNSNRRKIINLLKWKKLSATEIANHFDISKPSISRHLEVLKNAQLITSEKKGNQIFYSINMSILQEIGMQIIKLFGIKEELPK